MNAHCFLDGAYLREISKEFSVPLVDPRSLAAMIAYSQAVQQWRTLNDLGSPKERAAHRDVYIGMARAVFYDASSEEACPVLKDYWNTVELLPDTETKFGVVVNEGKRRRQKGVDGLVAVDMLEGAFSGLFQVAILVAGDGDFVPVVEAVRRRGVMVVVAAEKGSLNPRLRRKADRVWPIEPSTAHLAAFPPLFRPPEQTQRWLIDQNGKIRLDPEKP